MQLATEQLRILPSEMKKKSIALYLECLQTYPNILNGWRIYRNVFSKIVEWLGTQILNLNRCYRLTAKFLFLNVPLFPIVYSVLEITLIINISLRFSIGK